MLHKAWSSIEEVPYCFWRSSVKFQGHSAKKNRWFWPKLGVSRLKNRRFESNLSKITRPVAAIKSLRFALLSCWIIRNNRKYHKGYHDIPTECSFWSMQCRADPFNVQVILTGQNIYVILLEDYWQYKSFVINSLWPNGAIWCHWSMSTLAQVMACCKAFTWT